jgi:hypothetical protein
MAYENLICPSCSFPLSASPSQTQVACPRCFTWLELEAKCSGVCLSCHASKKAEITGSCAAPGDGVPVSIEGLSSKAKANENLSKNNSSKETLKALFKRVFNV